MLALWICLAVFGAYITISIILLRFPLLIRKKKQQSFCCKHISHRGGAGENLENTMTAFRHAIQHGTEMLEIDVQLTKDGEVVVSHDDDLERVTGQDILISDLDYHEIPPLLKTLDVTFCPGEIVSCCNSDRQIPLLRTLFEEFPDIPMNIDLKLGGEELIDKTIAMIREFKREHLVVLGNFSTNVVQYAHKQAPEIPVLFTIGRIITTILLFYFGLLPFVPLKEQFLEIPLPRIILRNPNVFQRYRWIIRLADWLLISPVLFRHLQRRGIQVYLFVINDERDFELCFERLHVDGIMTDYPTKLSSYLKSKEAASTKNDEQQPILSK